VEVPADVVASETASIIQKYQKLARLPGFRRGKVPATVIRQRFAEDVKSEVVEALVPRYFRQESEKQGLTPVSQPRVTDLHIHEGEPLRFKATFEVLPQIEVSGYEELRPEHKDASVTEDEVESALNNLREQHANYDPVEDRALADGDFAQVSFQGTPKESASEAKPEEGQAAAKPVNVDEVLVEIGGASTVKEFSENLRGVKPGEQREFDVVYAADFADQRLAGKTFHYSVTVKAIKQKQLPELNDDFAKELGDFADLNALKQRIREGLEHEKKNAAEQEAKDKLVDELLQRNPFPVPDSLVERQIDLRLERGLRALAAQGMRSEQLKKMDWSRLRGGQRESAEKEVRVALILDRIADREKIEVSDEEVDKEVEALAKQAQQPVESVRSRLTRDGALDRIRTRIRNEKTLDHLFRKSA
jgi:trigger factor